MKLRTIPRILIAAVLLSAGCGNVEGGVEESVSVSGLDAVIRLAPAPEEPMQFEISSNVGWSIVKKDLDWLTITPLRRLADTGQSTVTLAAMPNPAPGSRRGTFEIKAGENFSRTVTVEQAGIDDAPSLILSGIEEDAVWFGADDYPREVTLSCNRDWTAKAQGLDWCTISPLEGRGGRLATITIVPGKNEDSARQGRLVFDYGGETAREIVVGQAGFEAVISVSAQTVRASDTGRLEPAGIVVTSNGSWTATSSASWLTLDKYSGTGDETVTPAVEVNETENTRTATITFDNHGVKAVVTVEQSGKIVQYLTVSPKTVELSGKGTGVSVSVSANTAWTVTASESWITVSPASGSGDAVITISGTSNNTTEARQATVTVASTEVELLADDITVTQDINVSLDGYVDLMEEKITWICNDQALAMQTSPDFATKGENGSAAPATGAGTGVFYPSTHADIAYATYVKGNTLNYATTFIISVEGHYAFKKLWTGDAVEFRVPVVRIGKGSTLHFDFAIRATKATAAYYRAEASFDGGDTFVSFETGESYPGYGAANAKLKKKDSAHPFRATLTAPSTIELTELIVRITVADATNAVDGSSVSSPNTGTLRLTNTSTEPPFAGPTIYVTE